MWFIATRSTWPCMAVCLCLPPLLFSGCGRTQPGAPLSAQYRTADAASSPALSGAPSSSLERQPEPNLQPEFNTEQYEAITENPFVLALREPQSTFSIDVDTASYSNVRRLLQSGQRPPKGAVRIEELVNYFSYNYPEPDGEHPFSVSTELGVCPWENEHQLLRVALQGAKLTAEARPDCNLVFLLDVSGSMLAPQKLPLVKSAMQLLVKELNPTDRVAIVVYAGASGVVLDSTQAQQQSEILAAMEQLTAGGSTNGGQGIVLAYRLAQQNFIKSGINRVILCTDGDFNVGTTNDSDLVDLIQDQARSQVFLTVLGFGSGNLKDAKMEQLADKGNGNYAYIDSLLEARKVLVEQIGGTLVTIAKDVKLQLDFNPRYVQAYRLLGYENRVLENQDFRDDSKDAGEIGAGHSVTAFYEIIPPQVSLKSPTQPPSEFVQPTLIADQTSETLLTVSLRYKQPNSEAGNEFKVRFDQLQPQLKPSLDFQFASAVVAYGLLLRDSPYKAQANWNWVVETSQATLGQDPSGLRAEFLQLVKTARRVLEE
jgi:Ca-activated chloride channel family protein